MTRLKIVLLLTLPLLALAAFTAGLTAQGQPPHVFVGIATVNGATAAAGTPVTAWDGGTQTGITQTAAGGVYTIYVSRSAGPITFQVNGQAADRSYPQWVMGEVTTGFDLAVTAAGPLCPAGLAGFTSEPPATPAAEAGSQPPHVFVGTATVDGVAAAPGTLITAWDGSREIGRAGAGAGGAFTITVSRSSGAITFRIGGLAAQQSHPVWTVGEVTTGFVLSAAGVPDCAEAAIPVAQVAAALGGNLIRAFTFDNESKVWQFYDAGAVDVATLTDFVTGRPYFILVKESLAVTVGGKYRNFTCKAGNCWNLIVW